jgi:AAA15 family ATPase/GTPase
MIQELKIQNYLSFKNEVVFSFEATSDKTLEDYYVHEPAPGVRLLKMAMVYGANASGKSNLIKSFDFIKTIIFDTLDSKDEAIDFHPFAFGETENDPGRFELTFYVEGIKHVYSLEINRNNILSEKLSYYPGSQPAIIFDRHLDKKTKTSVIEFGAKIKISNIAKEEINIKTLKNRSVFAAHSQVNISIPELDRVYGWLQNQYMHSIDPYTHLTDYSDSHVKKNPKIKEFALKFLKEADFNISDISFVEEIKKIPDNMLKLFESAPITEEEKAKIRQEKQIMVENRNFEHVVFNNGERKTYTLPEERQSKGTMRFYGFTAPFYNTIEQNAFLPVDEIGSALHPLLVMHFIKEFLEHSESSSQLLFSTHNMSLLYEKEMLRRDAIWITEKNEEGATDIYSVADFPEFRKELSYYNFYKQGKFGGIPRVD